VWKRHWKLLRDPFLEGAPPYVPVAPHEEAVARLVDAIETGQKRAVVRAGAGLGKSSVLARALSQNRGPWRRSALVSSPTDGASLLAGLAEGLGRRAPASAGRAQGWKTLAEAVKLCRWQRQRVVLAIDDCQSLSDPSDRLDLARLTHLDTHPDARLTIVQTSRTGEADEPTTPADPWELLIRLPALTRTDAEDYLTAKLASAGRDDPTFTPSAVQRLHLISAGSPRGLDRLASLALMAGAVRGLEIIPPEIIEGVARECRSFPPVPAA
jgi:MSHA biogenesis protein MshM